MSFTKKISANAVLALIRAADLYTFGGKIQGKLKNTLGLFISLGAYSKECTDTQNPTTKSMILMDGTDLMQVLE